MPNPALIRSVRLQLDGKPLRRWSPLLAGLPKEAQPYAHSSFRKRVVSVGERTDVFQTGNAAKPFDDAVLSAWSRVTGTLCYCSAFDDCFSYQVETESTSRVDRCTEPTEAERFED